MGHNVTPEFLTTLNIPILAGRNFAAGDDEYSVIVDELFAQRYFKKGEAVGAEMWFRKSGPRPGEPWYRIIGVAARANLRGLEQRDEFPLVYHYGPVDSGQNLMYTILLRSSRPTESVVRDMRAKIREIDPRLPLSYTGSLASALDDMLLDRKGVTALLVAFAGVALLLSGIGVFAVLAREVSQRKKEFVIRLAIGSTRHRLLALVLSQASWRTVLGLMLGLFGAVYLTRFLESRLFDIGALDLSTHITALLILLVVSLCSSGIPALWATKVNPMETLKTD